MYKDIKEMTTKELEEYIEELDQEMWDYEEEDEEFEELDQLVYNAKVELFSRKK